MSMQQRVTQVIQRIASEIVAIRSAMGGQKIVKISQTDFKALAVKDPNTLYFLEWM